MSSESWEEQGEAPGAGQRQDRQHVHKDTQRMMENQGQPDVEEQCRPLDDADEVLVSQNVNGDKNKRKEKRGTWRRRMDTQKIKTGHVKQADGTLPVSVSFVERDRNNRSGDSRGRGPFFFFGGNNGASIVVSYCESRGWQRVYDNTRVDYKLKWCETKSPATYYNFKAGSQLVYQIPNNKVLTTKIGLLNSLREYDRISSYGRGHRTMRMEDFFPLTFRMDMRDEREAFLNRICNDTTSMWICKPSGLNQGRGIFLLRTPEDITAFREKLQNQSEQQSDRKSPFSMPQARIVQQYIQNPLLIKGRKFDVRSYFLIACTSPYMVFFRHGYVRLTCNLYDPNSDNLTAHLTNQYMQKKNPLYSELKEDTVWSMERFNTFINEMYMLPRDLPKDWVLGPFAKRMQNIIMQCFLAVKAKLECKLGYFDLIGCDFMIDENFKVWLLEMNCNPALHTNCEVLKEVVPKTVTETLDITLEIFKKCCCGLKLLPLESQRDFVLLYGGEPTLVAKQRHKTTVPYSTLHPKNTFTHNNTSKKNRAATIATPTGESTNRCNMSPASVATTETALKLPVSQPPVLSPSSSTSSSAAINFLSTKTLPSQQPVRVQTKRPLGVAAMTQKTQTTKASETNHPRSQQAKPFRARVELRLSNCTWQQPVVPPQIAPVRRALRSLPTPTLSKSFDSTQRLEAQGHQTDKGEHISCYLKTFKIDLAQPCSLQTVWTAKKEPREKENE